jgi:tetratricopeptide (TPR) repeat protein
MSEPQNEPLDLQAAEKFDHLAGQCWIHQQMADAVSYYRQALAIRKESLGPHHLEVADSLVRLGAMIGWEERDNHEAEAMFEEAVGIYEPLYQLYPSVKGKLFEHVFMGLMGTLGNLVGCAFRQGNLDKAEQHYRHIRGLIEECSQLDCRWVHPMVLTFAQILVQQGKVDEAVHLLEDAVNQPPRADSIQKVNFPHWQKKLADLYAEQGRVAEAEVLYRRVVTLLEGSCPPYPGFLATTLECLADVCRKTDRTAEAERLEIRARDLRDQA